jgi:hypothetical protein
MQPVASFALKCSKDWQVDRRDAVLVVHRFNLGQGLQPQHTTAWLQLLGEVLGETMWVWLCAGIPREWNVMRPSANQVVLLKANCKINQFMNQKN